MTVGTGPLGTQYTLALTVVESGSPDIPHNKSTVGVALAVIKNSGSGYASGSPTAWSITLDGVTVASGSLASYSYTGLPNGLVQTIYSGYHDVVHDTDGRLTLTCVGNWEANNPPQLAPGSTAPFDLVLTQIPRGPKSEYDGAWTQDVIYGEYDGVWGPFIGYAEYDGAWQVIG